MGNSSSTSSSPTSRSTDRNTTFSNTLSGAANNLSSRITGGGPNNNAHRPNLTLPSSLPSPFRGTGSLGLSKAELDARCRPSGLYPTCDWEPKAIRKLIGDGKLAARLRGSDSRITKSDRECPICFMYYSECNVTKCCEATICTECYLQIKTQRERCTTCPFCNNTKMIVSVQKGMDEDAIAKREEEEQRVIESIIRNRAAQVNGEAPGVPISQSSSLMNEASDGEHSFGSSLDNYNRSRTFSNSSLAVSENSSDPGTPKRQPANDSDALLSLAMSPNARAELEQEMAAQLSHETHQRMESEAEEARTRHAEEWARTDSGIRSRMRDARIVELTQLLERMSNRREEDGGEQNGGGRGGESLGDLLRALETYGSDRRGFQRGAALENLMRLEAALLFGAGDGGRRSLNRRTSSERFGSDDEQNSFSGGSNFSRRIVRALPRRGVSTTHMDTAEMLMRGISEEDQLAMAIAMSMQDANNQQQQQEQEGTGQDNVHNQDDQGETAGNEARESGSSSDSVPDYTITEMNNTGASTPLDDVEEEVVFETG